MNVDHEEIRKWQKAMCQARQKLQRLVAEVGHARQVIEMDGDRRKRLLARYKKGYLDQGLSNADADTQARADDDYGKDLDEWAESLEAAFTVRDDWTATQAKLEAARSLHSVARDTLRSHPE